MRTENYAMGMLFLLEDYFINEAISTKEMKDILALPNDEFNDFVSNYTLKGN